MNKHSKIFFSFCLMGSLISPAIAQYRNDNPNMRNFYMARQQVQILDDVPQVTDMRTNPQASQTGQANQAGQQAPAITAPVPLPRAGFNSYMSNYGGAGMKSGLPQVVNGVPPQQGNRALPQVLTGVPPKPKATGQQSNAGNLKMKSTPSVSGPVTAKTYSPYKRYQPAPVSANNSVGSGSLLNTNTSVRGSVLHWNKKRAGSYQ